MLNLELMYHWSTSTYDTITSNPELRQFWLQTVVKMGVGCHYVMQTLLAISALHIAHVQPERRQEVVPHALSLYSSASESARATMGNNNDEGDKDNLYLFALLTMIYGGFDSHKATKLPLTY